MVKTIWRRFLAERLARSIEARTAKSIDAKIALLEIQMRALISQRQADDGVSNGEARAVAGAMVEELRKEFRALGRLSIEEASSIADLAVTRI